MYNNHNYMIKKMSGLFALKFEAKVQEPQSSNAAMLDWIPDFLGRDDAIPDFLGHRDELRENKVPPRFSRSSSATCPSVVCCVHRVELWSWTLERGVSVVRLHSSAQFEYCHFPRNCCDKVICLRGKLARTLLFARLAEVEQCTVGGLELQCWGKFST